MNSQGVEISIAGYVREMVRDSKPLPFLLFLFYFNHILNFVSS